MKHFLITILSAFFLFSCKTTRILPDVPVSSNEISLPTYEKSTLNFPISMSIQAIEDLVNEKLPHGLIAKDAKKENKNLSYTYEIYRNKPIEVASDKNELVFKVPIDLKIVSTYTSCIGFWNNDFCCASPIFNNNNCFSDGVITSKSGTTNPSFLVEMRVKFTIDEQYNIKPTTYLKGDLLGDTDLHVDMLGNLVNLKLDVKDRLEPTLQQFLKSYKTQIDQKLAQQIKNVQLKKLATQYWSQIQKPIAIKDLWLTIQPEKIYFENIHFENKKIQFGLAIDCVNQINNQPATVVQTPLPALSIQPNIANYFNLYIPVTVDYLYLSNLLNQQFAGKEYVKEELKLYINQLNISGIEYSQVGALLVKANVKGKAKFKRFKGDLYFTAIPAIDDVKKEVFIKDFTLDAKTNSFLVNHKLPQLVDKFYYQKIKDEFKYSYKSAYEQYLSLGNQQINQFKIPGIDIKGTLKSVAIPKIHLNKNHLSIILIAKGNLLGTLNEKEIGLMLN